GAGSALVMPLAVTLLSAAFPAERRGRALGILEGVTGLATIGGPPLGGVIAQTVGWEWIFWINVPIALVVIPLAHRHITESHGPDTALDLLGMLLVAGAALGVVWGLVRGGEAGWTSPEVLGALAAGAVLALAFVRWELHTRGPLLPMGLFRSRVFGAATATSALLFAGIYGSVFFLAQLLQTGLGYSAATAGLALIPWTATLLLVAPVAGSVADRVGNRPVLVGGLTLMAVGLGWVALVAEPGISYLGLAVPLLVAGVGTSMAIPVVQNAVLGAVDPAAIGKASGVNTMAQELGGALGIAALVAVFTAMGGYDSPDKFLDGTTLAVGGCAAFALAGALVACAVPGRRPTTATVGS
ncbi:MAG: MFS transporter, partial [Pseudonocardia sp.]|nr:MFS transporter [Pseudonocardia sp.]